MEQEKKTNKIKAFFSRLLQNREVGILIPFLVICIGTAIINPVFLYPTNLVEIARSISFVVIMSVGMTFVLIAAGIDLSVGATIALAGVVAGKIMVAGLPVWLGILCAILTGALIGLINGSIIVNYKIPPMIATLGMMYIVRGAVYVITKGQPVYPFPDSFTKFGRGTLLGLPYAIYIAIVVLLIGNFVLKRTTFGRSVMAVGGNQETARVSGINVKKTMIIVYIIASVCASITGLLMAGRLSSAQANAGTGEELTVIASVIIGGTSLFGGSGSILGTLIGTSLMSVLTYAMVLTRVSVYWQNIVVGAIIILAVGIDTFRRSRMEGK